MIKKISKRDHSAIIVSKCRGLFNRNDTMVPPFGYLSEAFNVIYNVFSDPSSGILPNHTRMVSIREQLGAYITLSNSAGKSFAIYHKALGDRIIYVDNTGDIRDHTAGTVILSVAVDSKINGLTLDNRFFFTIESSVGDIGATSEFVYVYDPSLSSTARKIAGTKPGAGLAAAVSGTNGVIEPGQHVYAVSFITNTGHITPPGSHVILTSPSGTRKKTSLTGIPTGGSFVTKRRIWMSQVIRQYDGNITAVPLFFVGDINDNITTTATVDAYDSQLISSADPYLDLLEEVSAGSWLNMFDGRMVVCGQVANPHLIRISNQNEPEAYNSINGLKTIDRFNGAGPGGQGVTTTRSLRGNLYCWKFFRTYVLLPTGSIPIEWKLEEIDSTLGAVTRGVSKISDNPNPLMDILLVANQSGLFIFDGSYGNRLKPLTYVIETLWRKQILNVDLVGDLCVDPYNSRIYMRVNDTSGLIFFADYNDGLSWDTIKWSIWSVNLATTLRTIAITSSTLLFGFQGTTPMKSLIPGEIVTLTGTDSGEQISMPCSISLAFADDELRIMQCNGLKAWMGVTSDNYSWQARGNILADAFKNLNGSAIGEENKVYETKFNAQGQIIEATISKNGAGAFYITDLITFISPLYQETPQ